jgi:ABC-type transport system involved in multi-copper enzyme maturation permease subunit
MSMFREFLRFELQFRAKSLSTYVYFLLWFAFAFFTVASESFGPVGNSNGKVLLNGPFANTLNDSYAVLFGVIVISAIFGTSVLRDFQRDTYQLLFTKPISKLAYLGGRWTGSFITTVLVFSGLMLGTFAGTFAPWADHARIGPNHAWWYFQPFLSIVVVQIFFLGSLFFAVGALTRRIFIVYLQGVALFMMYLIGITVFSATRSLEHFWSGILDPVGLLMVDAVTRYWSVAEKNSLLLPLDFTGYSPGVFLYNRLLWAAVGVGSLLLLWALFPLSVEALTVRSQARRAAKARDQEASAAPRIRSLVTAPLPRVHPVFGASTTWLQFVTLTRLRLRTIRREIPFWAIVGLLVVFAINNGHYAGRVNGENVWPVTYLMLQAVEGGATLFFIIVAGLYAAELIWRERDNRFDGIHDSLPISVTVDWLSKFIAIAFIEAVLLAVAMLVGLMMQTIDGYHHYEVLQYLEELYGVVYPQMLAIILLAMFLQTLVSNKFLGHGILIGLFVLQVVLFNFGWENTLYLPGAVPAYTYSDMNGYGHFVPAIAWSLVYWFSVFGILAVVSVAFTRRGAEEGFKARTRAARGRLPGLAWPLVAFTALALGSGSWYYYNAHVLNEYLTAKDRRGIAADYERQFKRYETLPQPKVTAVDMAVDIDPKTRSFSGSGTYTLQNKTGVPMTQVHVADAHQTVTELSFDRPFHLVSRAPREVYSIYALETPLEPGEVLTMTFKAGLQSHGFKDGNELPQFAANGTFFDIEFLPGIGYDGGPAELDDPRRRREEHLPPLAEMHPRGDPVWSKINLFTANADWITYHSVVSTSADQIAIAPGYLKRSWEKDGRRYFEYDMGGTHILDFHAYVSARYMVRRDTFPGVGGPVNLEIYYDAKHPYNVEEMLEASRAGLEYFDANFSPFQFSQFRILEFPRYRGFAQSFPNTVPFSEGIGFITRVVKPTDVDLTYFVTAHELAHQWWGHQLIGGRVEGSNMMAETLAQYSAYMVMQKKYGKDYMHRVLRHFLDTYLRGRSGEVRHEQPLARVQREPYVWYDKGGQVMYTLADTIGEEKVNLALHDFLMRYRYANAANQEDAVDHVRGAVATDRAYPDTTLLVAALREQTPPEYQYLIDDGFDRIVLYDDKTLRAVSKRLPDGKYQVTLDVQARKVQADGNGAESPLPLDDFIEIGVFSGVKDFEQPLYLHREKMTKEHATYTVTVDRKPTRAGIDPYNKLIDRIADDNMIDVTGD